MRAAVATVGVIFGLGAGLTALDPRSRTVDHRFDQNISQYMALRRQVELRTPEPHVSGDRDEIGRAADAFAEALRAARPAAKPGDIFTPAIAADFKRRPCFASTHEDDGRSPAAVVNRRFDWRGAEATPPALIAGLPLLPEELQYRIVNCDLVLVDIVAGLVIDVVPRAHPEHRRPHYGL
jgi:hypothetical protein